MPFRKYIRIIHLWLGLTSGLVVMVIGMTGCINVFADELKMAIHPEWYTVPVATARLPLGKLLQNAQLSVGRQYPITRGKLCQVPGRTYEFRTLKVEDGRFGFWNYFTWYYRVYVDPYRGDVIAVEDAKHGFFDIILGLHTHLLLGRPLGKRVIECAVVIFVILLLSGLVLWWRRPAYRIKRKARIKRLNYDLHNVLGFYALLPLLAIALTGLGMSFEWTAPALKPLASATSAVRTQADEQIFKDALQRHPGAAYFFYNIPLDTNGVITVAAYGTNGRYYDRIADRYDRWSGRILERGQAFEDKPVREQFKALDFDVHIGAALGLPGRIIAFIASLIATSLPLTGLFIWLNKRKPRKKTSNTFT